MQRLYPYFKKMPVLTPKHDLRKVVRIAVETKREKDFFWSLEFHPAYYAELVYNGFLPIATQLPFPPPYPDLKAQILRIIPSLKNYVEKRGRLIVLLPKLHKKRCLAVDWKQLHVSKNARKRAKKFEISFDSAIEKVIAGCMKQHGEEWLFGPVRATFRWIHSHPIKRKVTKVGKEEETSCSSSSSSV
mmetsp:Transcript_20843/g.33576  ORF Transcript_20843/g.33576 Transcript_20843/m.33576 type:complete len:188 (-) Transcript_20843:297-860(-)